MTKVVSLGTSPRRVQMETFIPGSGDAAGGTSVVVAYGTEGLLDPFSDLIRGFCNNLVDQGFHVVLPHFFEISATQPGLRTVVPALSDANVRLWTDALMAAVNWCRADEKADKVALVGFSLGFFGNFSG